MADRFVSDDATCSTSMEQDDGAMTENPTNNKKVTFRIPIPASTETLSNLDRVNQLELAVNDLRQKLSAMHELLSRAIETNLQLKGRVPAYEPEVVQAAVVAAGMSDSSSAGAGGGGTTITILRANGNKLVLKGKTFDVKDDLKRQFSAQWDASLKCWSCSDSFETQVREFLTSRGFNLA